MSLATETSTAEEKTVYSVCGLLQFSKHYAGQLIVSVLFLLLAFGQKLWLFAVWCGWVCQVVTVLRSSLPQVR